MGWNVHHGFADVLARHDAFFLGGEVFIRVGKELEDFFYFVFFFGGDVVLFCELGARALRGCGGGACGCSAPLGRLWEDVSRGPFGLTEDMMGMYHDSGPGAVCAACGGGWCWLKCDWRLRSQKLGVRRCGSAGGLYNVSG